MIYQTRKGQTSSGEAIGILLLDTSVPFIPGDVANATTYHFPVRFQKVPGFTVQQAIGKDPTVYDSLKAAAQDLVAQGVRAVTGDCGFMAVHQRRLADDLGLPVFLSSLLQIPFILSMLGTTDKIGVVTADGRSLDENLLAAVDVSAAHRLVIQGLEAKKHFYRFAIEETGELDPPSIEAELIETARELMTREPTIKTILLECSLLPPYAAALQAAVKLPVFDYVTMINFVFSAVVRTPFVGFM
jgi:hypothetical protein